MPVMKAFSAMSPGQTYFRSLANHRIRELLRARIASDILRQCFARAIYAMQRGFYAARGNGFIQIIQHHDAAHDQRSGIRDAASRQYPARCHGRPRKLRASSPMLPLGTTSQSADEPRCQIAHHVSVKIRQQQHIKLLGLQDELHAGVVHDHFVVFDCGILLCHGAASTSGTVRRTVS